MISKSEFVEVFIDTPLDICMQRDPKGLYEKAKAGKIKNFTGIDSPYEPPEQAELAVRTTQAEPEHHAQVIVDYLRGKGYLG
jgi:bifunctional enzyme CysN/CysC